MPARYTCTANDLIAADTDAIVGRLTSGARSEGFAQLRTDETFSWGIVVETLKGALTSVAEQLPCAAGWHVLFEYPIPRRQRRIDAVILADDIIGVLEFKSQEHQAVGADERQVEEYCLDLRDFHEASAGLVLAPVVVSGTAGSAPDSPDASGGVVLPVRFAAHGGLADALISIHAEHHVAGADQILGDAWDDSPYRPVPTIIEAARLLYAGQGVRDIGHAHADAINLTATADALIAAISEAQREGKKIICFVTGIPGAGKTLAGLNVIHSPEITRGGRPAGAFLSGNGPLVIVLREALAQDNTARTGMAIGEARREVKTFVQNVHHFIIDNVRETTARPAYEHAVVWDEAQRAWNAAQVNRKRNIEKSEPELTLEIMDRHEDWAAVVALVGGGQEIHTGEAGLAEWGRALAQHYPHWQIRVSPEVLSGGESVAGSTLFPEGVPSQVNVREVADLHLPISLRSYRAEAVASWANAVVAGETDRARDIRQGLGQFPIHITRSLDVMRQRLKRTTRGERRCGLLASSGARRLRPFGVDVTARADVEHWFLAPPGDVRSSHQLEVVATEFECQGLELDHVGLCWGSDLTWVTDARHWRLRRFRGTTWQNIASPVDRDYLLNKYRVLLTRARESLVIWVPPGKTDDPTMPPAPLDATFEYLVACGAEPL